MRQILVLGLLAFLGWWLYGQYVATPVDAASGGPDASSGEVVGGAEPVVALEEVLGRGAGPEASGDAPGAPVRGASLDADGQRAFSALLQRIGEGDARSIDLGFRALATGRLSARQEQRLASRLAPPEDADFEARLKALGEHNGFLHSARGRELAEGAFGEAMAMEGQKAVDAGTRFLALCLRGRIEKEDTEARAFVERTYARYRRPVDQWLCNPGNVAGARSYTVASGDSLNGIARRFRRDGIRVEEGALAVLNRIHNKNAIRVGQRIKIPVDPIHAVIEKRSYSLSVYVGRYLLRLYWVGHGREDKTPVTTFTVGAKKPRPQWTAPDGNVYQYGHPKNILGEFWIALRHPSFSGFGIHGTPMPETIGTMSSDGCIRMMAGDIDELFELLPRGAEVEVRASEAP